MNQDLTFLENRKCLDRRTGECLGIVLTTSNLTRLHNSQEEEYCLDVIKDGIHSITTYLGGDIENLCISPEPITMTELIHNASILFRRWQVLEASEAGSRAETVAYHERNDYLAQLEQILQVNGLDTEFNMEFLTTSVCCISFY